MTFTDFMAPGIIMTIVHSMALGYSAMIIIMERTEGLLDRTWVAGVTPGEFALAHFLVSLVVNLLQVVVTLVFMILVFQVKSTFVCMYLTNICFCFWLASMIMLILLLFSGSCRRIIILGFCVDNATGNMWHNYRFGYFISL